VDYDDIVRHIGEGFESARKTLGVLTGREVEVTSVTSCEVSLSEVPFLAGAPESLVLASYVRYSGDCRGQILILYRPDNARDLARSLVPEFLAELEGAESEVLLESVVSEVSNILGSAALNAIADGTESTLRPSPPYIIRDMAGAILEAALASGAVLSEKVPVVDVAMKLGETNVGAEMIFLPECT
jgi:chemotaxis protein CheY-P-specific phosphatase CheC